MFLLWYRPYCGSNAFLQQYFNIRPQQSIGKVDHYLAVPFVAWVVLFNRGALVTASLRFPPTTNTGTFEKWRYSWWGGRLPPSWTAVPTRCVTWTTTIAPTPSRTLLLSNDNSIRVVLASLLSASCSGPGWFYHSESLRLYDLQRHLTVAVSNSRPLSVDVPKCICTSSSADSIHSSWSLSPAYTQCACETTCNKKAIVNVQCKWRACKRLSVHSTDCHRV